MTDREMLELAAKAAGVKHSGWLDSPYAGERGGLRVGPPKLWNPFANDGDALRLAVMLGMEVYIDTHPDGCECVEVESHTHKGDRVIINFDGDPIAATRRAITRCAAAIGEAM